MYHSQKLHFLSIAADLADLIFVFFDPIGQALCKRTLNLVEKINEKHADRMRFYLSKADEAGHESDRQVGATLCPKPAPLHFVLCTLFLCSQLLQPRYCSADVSHVE